MGATEQALSFACGAETLLGIVHSPVQVRKTGIVIVAGAPQYRVGVHRLFVTLARRLADEGYAVLRFDRRGTGDSSGSYATFENIRDDMAAAVQALRRTAPKVEDVVLLGLCDGASAILLDGITLEKTTGAILINPWAPTEDGRARAMLTSYYWSRIRNLKAWSSSLAGLVGAVGSLVSVWRRGSPRRTGDAAGPDIPAFISKMFYNWQQFSGNSLVILAQDDLTAASFDAVLRKLVGWRRLTNPGRISRHRIKNADHTFSSAKLTGELANAAIDWLNATTTR